VLGITEEAVVVITVVMEDVVEVDRLIQQMQVSP